MGSEKSFHIGCQSWGYDDWITPAGGPTVFYPRGTRREKMLELYSRIFGTIEVDSTLYGIPSASSLEGWYAETPPGFLFSLKFPRQVTHDLSLGPRAYPIAREFVERAAHLQEKLGLFLIQLPASFDATKENAGTVRDFLAELPPGARYAMEFRDAGWFTDWTYEELDKAGISLALVEGKWIHRDVVLSAVPHVRTDFAYIRIMGERDLPVFDHIQRHRDDVIDRWTDALLELAAAEEFVYVDNYFEGHAPATAAKFMKRLDIPLRSPEMLDTQGTLF